MLVTKRVVKLPEIDIQEIVLRYCHSPHVAFHNGAEIFGMLPLVGRQLKCRRREIAAE